MIALYFIREPVRVCGKCHGIINERRISKVAGLINTDDDDDDPSVVDQAANTNVHREDEEDLNTEHNSSLSHEEEYVIIPLEQARDKPNQFPVGLDSPAQHSTIDVDALRSKLSQLETVDNPMLSPTGSLPPGSVNAKELFFKSADIELEGGGVHHVRIQVDVTGVVIIWEFSTEPKVCIMWNETFNVSVQQIGNCVWYHMPTRPKYCSSRSKKHTFVT